MAVTNQDLIERGPVTTTLNAIRAYRPCKDDWENLLKGLNKTEADDEPLPLTRVLEINGLHDAIRCLKLVEDHRKVRLFAVKCARRVQHIVTDERIILALDVAEAWCRGEATDEELAAARDAARAVNAREAAARDAARDFLDFVVWCDARSAILSAAYEIAWIAVSCTATHAARYAVRGSEIEAQAEIFKEIFGEGE